MKLIPVVTVAVAIVATGAVLTARHFFARPAPTGFDRTSVTLEVFNGCGVPRIARAVADELLNRGFDVYDIGNCDSLYDSTVVVDLLDPMGARAESVAIELAVPRRLWGLPLREQVFPVSLVELDSSRYVDLRLVVGRDYETFFPEVPVLR